MGKTRKRNRSKIRTRAAKNAMTSRLLLLFVAFFIGLGYLGYRVVRIKADNGATYETAAMKQQTSRIDRSIGAVRGSIVDRNKRTLASSNLVYNIILDPRQMMGKLERKLLTEPDTKDYQDAIKGIDTCIQELSTLLDLDYSEIRSYVDFKRVPGKNKDNDTIQAVKDSSYVKIATKISVATAEKLKAKMEEGKIFCVWLEEDSYRVYEQTGLPANIVGFIRGDAYWGLENRYNEEMTGKSGREFITNSVTVENQYIPPETGHQLITTLDKTIQQHVQSALQSAVDEYDPQHAGIVVMKPKTGEILGMASYPSFNPNDPTTPIYLDDAEFLMQWEQYSDQEKSNYLNSVWKNFNITDTFEPGSIFKPLVVASALEQNYITEDDMFICNGVIQIADRAVHCHKKTGHGSQTLKEVLANSCNVAMMEIAENMGADAFYDFQREFGVGEVTGIDLPAEQSGYYLMYHKGNIKPIDLANMAFGQSFNVTPLQILNSFAAVINGGNLMQPYVVSQIVDKNGKIVKEITPQIKRKIISEETSAILRQYLRDVVEEGTGKRAHINGYEIGGKTGTAQQGNKDVEEKEYATAFIAFLPVEDPEILAITVIDRASTYTEGGTSAAPITKQLFENIIAYLGIKPTVDIDTDSSVNVAEEKNMILSDYTGKNVVEVTDEIIKYGLKYQVTGKGSVVSAQMPAAGTDVRPGSQILLYLSSVEGETDVRDVPNVIGLTYTQAVTEIVNMGFEATLGYSAGESDLEKIVIAQDPAAYSLREMGTIITMSLE